MNRFTIAVLVNNKFGVLNRVTSMFRRRRFNINALTVSETESNMYSRITVVFDGDEGSKDQLINQLYKLPDVCSLSELKNEDTVNCELLLIKLENSTKTRDDIRAAADAFNAKTMDYAKDSIILMLADSSRKIDDFISLMREYKILEICRTGCVSLEKGSSTIRNIINL